MKGKKAYSSLGLLLALALLLAACGSQTPAARSDAADAITPTARGGNPPVASSTTAPTGTTQAAVTGDQRGEISSDGQTSRAPGTTVAAGATGMPLNTPGAMASPTGGMAEMRTTLPSREITPQPGGPNSPLQTPGTTPTVLAMGTPVGNLTDPMTESLRGLSGKDFEVSFLQQMIAHHKSAVEMAQLVPTRSKRTELLNLSQNIVTTQNREIDQMKNYLQSWYNAQPLAQNANMPGMNDMMMTTEQLQKATGDDFDRLFLRDMIKHHEQALNMANLLPTRTQRPELLQLGQTIITAQAREIDQMRNWLATNFK